MTSLVVYRKTWPQSEIFLPGGFVALQIQPMVLGISWVSADFQICYAVILTLLPIVQEFGPTMPCTAVWHAVALGYVNGD